MYLDPDNQDSITNPDLTNCSPNNLTSILTTFLFLQTKAMSSYHKANATTNMDIEDPSNLTVFHHQCNWKHQLFDWRREKDSVVLYLGAEQHQAQCSWWHRHVQYFLLPTGLESLLTRATALHSFHVKQGHLHRIIAEQARQMHNNLYSIDQLCHVSKLWVVKEPILWYCLGGLCPRKYSH